MKNFFRRWRRSTPVPSSVSHEPEPRGLFSLLNMAWIGQGIYTVTELGIPDLLTEGPASVEDLAERSGANREHLGQVMRALAGFSIFQQEASGNYALTPMSRALVKSEDAWMRDYVLLWGEQLYPAGGEMLEMVRSGKVAFEVAHGADLYAHYRQVPAAGDRFVNFMNAVTDWQREIVVQAIDVASVQHIVDVGGGRASMLTRLLQNHPHLRGTIQDQPHMEDLITARITETGLSDRCTFYGGSFLESVAPGADLYTIKHVLHDWADADVITMLKQIATAMPEDATLIIIEGILDDTNGVDRVVKMRDLEQMIWTGGKVRSYHDFAHLLEQAGLKPVDVKRTDLVDASLLTCRKV